jgi:hypothetical protein
LSESAPAGEACDHLAQVIAAFGDALRRLRRLARALGESCDIGAEPLRARIEALERGAGRRVARRQARPERCGLRAQARHEA